MSPNTSKMEAVIFGSQKQNVVINLDTAQIIVVGDEIYLNW